ncbi:MAG TPA: hypothetical protein VES97_02265, partial [Solirubrobacteraceae bacterium]|nr:hypothetical protein [Solirubrobacteraceae bacterium]
PLTKAAKTGLPGVKKSLDLTIPVLENLRPVLHNLDPFLQSLGEYVPEIQAFFANLTAASEESGGNATTETRSPHQHLLTQMLVFNPQSLALYAKQVGTSRSNPYPHSGAFGALASGLPVFSSGSCSSSAPSVSGPANETISESIIEQLIQFKVANKPEGANEVAAPACNQQGPFTFNGQTSQFPHVVYGGK